MTKITDMLVHNIEIDEGNWGERWVPAWAIEDYPGYSEDIGEDKYFFLAIKYLNNSGEVYSTEDAKIDYYTTDEVSNDTPELADLKRLSGINKI